MAQPRTGILIVGHGSHEQPSNLEFERWSSASSAHDHVTPAATRAIADAQLVARYTTYIKVVGRTYSLQGILRIGIDRRDWPGVHGCGTCARRRPRCTDFVRRRGRPRNGETGPSRCACLLLTGEAVTSLSHIPVLAIGRATSG